MPPKLQPATAAVPDAGGSLEAWQPDALAARFGDRLFRVTKPFFSGGAQEVWFAFT